MQGVARAGEGHKKEALASFSQRAEDFAGSSPSSGTIQIEYEGGNPRRFRFCSVCCAIGQ
jgi:hypothetical protein